MFKEKEKLLENYRWNQGNPSTIREYYRDLNDKLDDNKSYSFYTVIQTGDRIIHSGLPQSISNTIIDLIGVDNVQVEPLIESEQDIVEPIFDEYELLDKLETAVEQLTWSGEAFAKFIVVDGEIDIEMVNPLNARIIKRRGKAIGYEFIVGEEKTIESDRGTKEKKERTIEIYGVGYIKTVLQEKAMGAEEWVTVKVLSNFTFDLKAILVSYIKIPKNAYSTSVQIFDAIDEGLSRMIDEARKGKMERFMDENLIPTGEDGQKLATEAAKVKDWIKLQGVRSEDGKPLIDYIMSDIDPDKRYLIVDKALVKKAVSNSGLSFHTFQGGELKLAPSAEAQRELEKQSIRTRKRYVNRLKKFIASIYSLILELEYTQLKVINTVVDAPSFLGENITLPPLEPVVAIRELEKRVSVIFEDYIQNSMEDRIKTWGSQEAQANFPIAYRIKKTLEGEVSDEEIAELVAQSKEEQGIMVTPDPSTEDQ